MKLLATDYDGTLKYQDHVTKEDRDAILRWKEAGNLFVIDTGRSMESILGEATKYDLPVDYFVTNNGGMLFNNKQEELFSSYLDTALSLEIMKSAHTQPDCVSYVANDGFYRHRIIINDQLEEHRYPGLEPNMSEEDLWKMGKYAQIVISLENRERAKELETKLREEYGDCIEAYANKYVVDVVPKGMSKATGIEIVRKKEGIDLEDLYTIGDAANDLTLMEYGYNGCVMDYALPEVKAHAKREYRCIAALVDDVMKNANE